MDPPCHQPAGGAAPPDERRLILLRHGESTWNRENRFTGWTDVDLSAAGIAEAQAAARLLIDDAAHRPRLSRHAEANVRTGPDLGALPE